MGVEYKHGLFVRDLMWRPSWEVARAATDVLARWKLVAADPPIYVLGDGEAELPVDRRWAGAFPENLRIVGDWIEDREVVERVVGASLHGELEERYLASVAMILGVDFKAVSCEEYDCELDTTLEEARYEVPGCFPVYAATWTSAPPRARLERSKHAPRVPRGFAGVWRSGILIDCNKDLPAIADGKRRLPAAELVRELEGALGTELVELGWFD